MITDLRLNVNEMTSSGESPLLLLCMSEQPDVEKTSLLLRLGADVNHAVRRQIALTPETRDISVFLTMQAEDFYSFILYLSFRNFRTPTDGRRYTPYLTIAKNLRSSICS
jgi:ankyrin repeat protein